MTTHRPRYENRGVSALKALVRPGDCVVIVGGGLGVTPVWAARMAGSRGRVDVYECDADSVATVRETCHKNGVENRVTVHHERVGPDTNLPECDVLEVDCEGCELDLIPNLGIEPRVTIVEYHETHDTV